MSFSDLMSSGRGPGVVGMLLALVVMAGFGILFLFAFDDGMQGADQSIESVIAQQAKDIDSLKASIEDTRKGLESQPALEAKAKQLKSVHTDNLMSAGKIEGLRKSEVSVKETINGIVTGFEKYKDEYRVFARAQAKGEQIPSLTTLTGKVYEAVMIREVTPIGMQIRHKDGHMRIPYEELPKELQDRFQFDSKQKNEALVAESNATKEHNSAVAKANDAVDQALANQKERDQQAAQANAARALATKKSQISSMKDEIQRLERAITIETHKKLSRAPQMREELADKQTQLSTLENQVTQLESMVNP